VGAQIGRWSWIEIKVISELFKQRLMQGEASTFCTIYLRGDYLTCLAHIAQIIPPGEYAAIEYCEDRTWAFANSYKSLLDILRCSAIPR
jgi:hypothetical protein